MLKTKREILLSPKCTSSFDKQIQEYKKNPISATILSLMYSNKNDW